MTIPTERIGPWRAPGCSWPGCDRQDCETLSRWGRRCAAHPIRFDVDYALFLIAAGWSRTLAAYLRTDLPCEEAA